jgi:fluoride exporter
LVWYVAVGSALGGVARFLLGTLIQRASGTFPSGTLVVNVAGSLLLGFLLRYALGSVAVSPETRAFLTTGFCGGFTTFSTFSYETIALLEEGQHQRAAVYIALSVVLSLAACLAGVIIAREVLAARARL